MDEYERNLVGPPLGARRSCRELMKAARKGREKALLSISQYCVRLLDTKRNVHEIWTNQPPCLSELVKTFGPDFQVVGISRERRPMREEIKAIPYFEPTGSAAL